MENNTKQIKEDNKLKSLIENSGILRTYVNSVPWELDKKDVKIINRMHGKHTEKEVVKKLWEQASKN